MYRAGGLAWLGYRLDMAGTEGSNPSRPTLSFSISCMLSLIFGQGLSFTDYCFGRIGHWIHQTIANVDHASKMEVHIEMVKNSLALVGERG